MSNSLAVVSNNELLDKMNNDANPITLSKDESDDEDPLDEDGEEEEEEEESEQDNNSNDDVPGTANDVPAQDEDDLEDNETNGNIYEVDKPKKVTTIEDEADNERVQKQLVNGLHFTMEHSKPKRRVLRTVEQYLDALWILLLALAIAGSDRVLPRSINRGVVSGTHMHWITIWMDRLLMVLVRAPSP